MATNYLIAMNELIDLLLNTNFLDFETILFSIWFEEQRILHCSIFNNWNLSEKENIISDKMMTPRFLCKQRTVLLWAIFIKPAYIRLPTTYSFQEA